MVVSNVKRCLNCGEKLSDFNYGMVPWAIMQGLEDEFRICFKCKLLYRVIGEDVKIYKLLFPGVCSGCGFSNKINFEDGKPRPVKITCVECGKGIYTDEFKYWRMLLKKDFLKIQRNEEWWQEE